MMGVMQAKVSWPVAALVVVAFIIFLYWLFYSPPEDAAHRTECMNNVRQIGLAMMQYAGEHEGKFPESFGVLLKENYLITAKVFLCPSTGKRLPPEGFPVPDEKTYFSTYDLATLSTVDHWADYVIVKGITLNSPAESILLHDRSAEDHKGEGRNCFFVDGHVHWHNEPDFQERMTRQREEMARATANPPETDNAP